MLKRFLAVIVVGMLAMALVLPLSFSQATVSAAPLLSTVVRIRLINAANTSTALDLDVDGTRSLIIVGVPAITASKYDSIATGGSHTITLYQTTTTTTVGTPLTFNFADRTNYTLVLLPDMTWAEYVDSNPAPAVGTANARLINLSPNNNPVNLAVTGTVPLDFTNIAYKSAGATYFNLAAGAYTLTIPGSSALAKSFNPLAGHVYSILVYWDAAKNLPVIVPENDANTLAGTPTATATLLPPTSTNTPLPTATSTVVVGTPAVTTTPVGSLSTKLFLPVITNK